VRATAYPQYKDSGIEWLGPIPAHWEAVPYKTILSRNDSGVWGDEPDGMSDTMVLRSTEQSVDGEWRIDDPAARKLTARDKYEALLREGDLVVTKSSGSQLHIGKTSYVDGDVASLRPCFSNFMQRLRLRAGNAPRLYWFFMNSPACRQQLVYLSSTTTGLGNLNGGVIGAVRAPVAPTEEQQAIADYLDRETAKIDALVKKKERLIELLQEKRTALISHAVTKGLPAAAAAQAGLDPNVPMKDSGIEWLGQIPEHWSRAAIKRACSLVRDGTHQPPSRVVSGYRLLSVRNIIDGSFVFREDDSRISETDFRTLERSFSVLQGDILLAIVGATLGKVAIVGELREPFTIQRSLAVLRPRCEVLGTSFMAYMIQSSRFQQQLWANAGYSAQPGLYLNTLGSFRIPVPGLEEQQAIIGFLDRETGKIDALIAKVQEAIERLKEYRTALISAAVTGKIDVRGT